MDTEQVTCPVPARQIAIKATNSSGYLLRGLTWFLAGLLSVSQAGCHSAQPSDTTAGQPRQNVEYHWNCGLNVGYITLRLFHKEVDIAKLVDELEAGAHFERNISLVNLKKAFEKYGLIAEGFKADYPEEIIGFAKSDSILIVCLESGSAEQIVGHFILIKVLHNDVLVIDPPCHPQKFTKQDIIEGDVLSNATGEFLTVHK